MREPMSLLAQANAFKNSNRQRLTADRTVRPRPAVYSSFTHVDDSNVELKTLSLDVYASKHLVTTGKSILPHSQRGRLEEFLLPSINKDVNHDENRRRRKRRRPSYRKSLFHTYSSTSTQADLAHLAARGKKSALQRTEAVIRDDDTVVSLERHHAPPPSPSNDEIERSLYDLQDISQSPPPSRQSPVELEGYIPFRLPALNRSARVQRTPSDSPAKDIRSTLSDYFQKYY
jgi:hypothetical protein